MTPEEYPTVTQIIEPWSHYIHRNLKIDNLQEYADRGTRVHTFCKMRVLKLWIPRIDLDCLGYVNSFEQWYRVAVASHHKIEERLFDHELKFSGQFDCIARMMGHDCYTLLDWKTGSNLQHYWKMQMAAYTHLSNLNGTPIHQAKIVRLKKDGSRPIVTAMDKDELEINWNLFKSSLEIYNYFKEKKVI